VQGRGKDGRPHAQGRGKDGQPPGGEVEQGGGVGDRREMGTVARSGGGGLAAATRSGGSRRLVRDWEGGGGGGSENGRVERRPAGPSGAGSRGAEKVWASPGKGWLINFKRSIAAYCL